MPTISLSKPDIPFLLGGTGQLTLDTGPVGLNTPIPSDAPLLFDVGFRATGGEQVVLGQANTVKIGVTASAHARVVPIFSSSTGAGLELLKAHGLAGFFAAGLNPDRMVLAFDLGAALGVGVAGSFAFAPLTATVTVDAGADGGYSYLKAFRRTTPSRRPFRHSSNRSSCRSSSPRRQALARRCLSGTVDIFVSARKWRPATSSPGRNRSRSVSWHSPSGTV